MTDEIHDPFAHGRAPRGGGGAIAIRVRGRAQPLWLDPKPPKFRADAKGVIFAVAAKTEEGARAMTETLPLAKQPLMDHEYIPVGPWMTLRAWLEF